METKPHATWPERLKWAEELGLKNLQEKFTTGDNMKKEAQATLTYVLAGIGGTFAFMAKGLDASLTPFVFGNVVLCAWFTVLGLYLFLRTMWLDPFPAPFQDPQNVLLYPGLSIDTMRRLEIANIERRIVAAHEWIEKKSKAINRVRGLLLVSPIIFLAAVVIHRCWGHLG